MCERKQQIEVKVTKVFIRLPSAGCDNLFDINVKQSNDAFTKAGQHSLVDLLL